MKTLFLTLCFGLFLLSSCTKEEPAPIQSGYQFYCVTGADTLETQYGFQVVFGDTLDSTGVALLDFDYVLFSQSFAEVPGEMRIPTDSLNITGKYCQMFVFYFVGGNPVFINTSFYCQVNDVLYFSECCHDGMSSPFLITE